LEHLNYWANASHAPHMVHWLSHTVKGQMAFT